MDHQRDEQVLDQGEISSTETDGTGSDNARPDGTVQDIEPSEDNGSQVSNLSKAEEEVDRTDDSKSQVKDDRHD